MIRKGEGDKRAVFTAEVPKPGSWELELHLPRGGNATWHLTVEDPSGGEQKVQFDAKGAQVGWNALGNFEIASGEVRVVLSNETNGRRVMADAIRWVPPRGSATEG